MWDGGGRGGAMEGSIRVGMDGGVGMSGGRDGIGGGRGAPGGKP